MAYPPIPKAAKRASLTSISTTSSTSSVTSTNTSSQTQAYPHPPPPVLPRRQSSSIQLIPHSHTPTYVDSPLTPSEHSLIAATEENFNDHDLSSQDFDFEDVFTFDRPHRKIPRVVEVSAPSRVAGGGSSHHHPQQQVRDWSNFSFSHYGAVAGAAQQQGGHRGKTAHHQQYAGHGQVKLKQGMAGMQRELGLGIGAAYLRNQQALMRGRR